MGRSSLIALGIMVLTAVACGDSTSGNETSASTAPPLTTTTSVPETPVLLPDTPTSTEAVDLVAQGKSLAARNGCSGCHSPDGSPLTGPTWLGLYGKQETLADDSTVTVDEAYLTESIVDPNAKIVDGYAANIMPADFGDRLSDEDIAAIIAYIKSLG